MLCLVHSEADQAKTSEFGAKEGILKGQARRVFLGGTSGKEPACQCRRHRKCRLDPWVWEIPWEHDNPLQYSCLEIPTDRGPIGSQRLRHDWSDWARKQGEWVAHSPAPHQSIFQGYTREPVAGSVISSCTILWLEDIEITGLTLSILRRQQVWRLRALDHQVANFFHLVVVLASVKQLRKYASDTVIWILQRGNYSRRCRGGVCPGKAPAGPAWLYSCFSCWSPYLSKFTNLINPLALKPNNSVFG